MPGSSGITIEYMSTNLKALLAVKGIVHIEPSARTKLGLLLRRDGVRRTSELKRIKDLPSRTWDESSAQALADVLTPLLAEPDGEMRLKPVQAQALHELYMMRGLAAPITVGGGKTLISFLAPVVLEAKRPLLVIPASLRDKTETEFRKLERHWEGRRAKITIIHYANLSHENGMELLRKINPDLIIADECHRLKNPRAACTKRVIRWMDENPETVFLALSGTFTDRSLKDYAHITEWCLPKVMPLPRQWSTLVEWCQAVDEKVQTRMAPGALSELYNEEERKLAGKDELAAVRMAVRRRFEETPGVVASLGSEVHASLRINPVIPKMSKAVDDLFSTLRDTWCTPEGEEIASPVDMWRHAQELAMGFVYRWDPPAPADWMYARSNWAKCCRHILKYNRTELDSEKPVISAVKRGEYDGKILYNEGFPVGDGTVDQVLNRWLDIKPAFVPNSVPVWYHDEMLQAVAKWMKQKPGIVWVSHVAFGYRLKEITGAPYYRQSGREVETKAHVSTAVPKHGSIIVAMGNTEGQNLQAWHRNLVTCPPPRGRIWEQLIGRTHREGQEADEVVVDTIFGCIEMLNAFGQAMNDADYIASGRQQQKLHLADMLVDFDAPEFSRGPRWVP